MKFRTTAVFLVAGSLTLGCGTNDKPELVKDLVAFVAPGSDTVFRMNTDGTNVTQRSGAATTPRVWANQLQVLNSVCAGVSDNLDAPIQMFSPDGAPLGPLDDSWKPEWSPDGTQVAVACGRDIDGDRGVVIVSDVEKPGEKTEAGLPRWSRTGQGSLSSRMEIFLIAADGSSVTQLTANMAGDWLPRWHPSGKYILIESNRDNNSEIYQLATDSTEFFQVTRRAEDDQAPVWSRDGYTIAFASNTNGDFEVHVAVPGIGESRSTGQAGRPVPWQD